MTLQANMEDMARQEAGASRSAVAALAGREASTLESFERGLTMPHELERVLAAYAQACDTGVREIVARALELWNEHGSEAALGDFD